jgi:hypothetical protein
MSDEEPLSPATVSAHVLVLLILLFSGCFIEWAKQRYHPPFLTNAMLAVGEVVILVYMIGSLGKAILWTINEWRGNETIVQGRKEGFWKQFIPRSENIRRATHLGRIRRIIVIIIVFMLLMFFTEINRSDIMMYPPREPLLLPWIEWISGHNLYIVPVVATITGITVIGVLTTIILKLRIYSTPT